MRTFPTALVLLLLAGCEVVSRGDVTARRHLGVELGLPSSTAAVKPAPGARQLRLMPVDAHRHLGTNLVQRLPGGELRDHPQWGWVIPPHKNLALVLKHRLWTDAGLDPRDHPDADRLKVILFDCSVDPAAKQVHARATAQVTAPDGQLRYRVVAAAADWNGELPGDLAERTGEVLRKVADEVAAFAGSAGSLPTE